MKVLVDIADNKFDSFMELIKGQAYLKAKLLSAPDAAILEEINHIRKAFKLADKLQAGKIKSRPAAEFLNEL
jgi:hypothetical protein